MADLVIDEWLWSDLAGQNTVEKQYEAFQFLEAVFNKCDRFVTVKDSKFVQKYFEFCKHADIKRRHIVKLYKARFLYNSEKSVMLEEAQLEGLTEQVVTEIKPDDHYLVRAYLSSKASVIVTTDNPLMDVLTRHGITCKHRHEFVPAYILEYGRK